MTNPRVNNQDEDSEESYFEEQEYKDDKFEDIEDLEDDLNLNDRDYLEEPIDDDTDL